MDTPNVVYTGRNPTHKNLLRTGVDTALTVAQEALPTKHFTDAALAALQIASIGRNWADRGTARSAASSYLRQRSKAGRVHTYASEVPTKHGWVETRGGLVYWAREDLAEVLERMANEADGIRDKRRDEADELLTKLGLDARFNERWVRIELDDFLPWARGLVERDLSHGA